MTSRARLVHRLRLMCVCVCVCGHVPFSRQQTAKVRARPRAADAPYAPRAFAVVPSDVRTHGMRDDGRDARGIGI